MKIKVKVFRIVVLYKIYFTAYNSIFWQVMLSNSHSIELSHDKKEQPNVRFQTLFSQKENLSFFVRYPNLMRNIASTLTFHKAYDINLQYFAYFWFLDIVQANSHFLSLL